VSIFECRAQGYTYYILRSDLMAEKKKKTATQSYFSRKIGNTTFMVSVSFSKKATESMDDKIFRLIASEIHQAEVQKCS
jgi:hypothetical protein